MIHTVILARQACILALLLLLEACDPAARTSIVGHYHFVGSDRQAVLELRADGSYEICAGRGHCSGGRYQAEHRGGDFDNIGFDNFAFAAFEYGDPPHNAKGQTLSRMAEGGGWIRYDDWSCPCIQFDDPDSGVMFVKDD